MALHHTPLNFIAAILPVLPWERESDRPFVTASISAPRCRRWVRDLDPFQLERHRCCFLAGIIPGDLRNLSRVTSCRVAGVSVAGNSSVSSIRRHGGRGEVGVAELTASAGAEESFGKQLEIRGFPAGVRPRFTLEDEGRSATSSSKRRHHMVSGSNSSTTRAAPQPKRYIGWYSPPTF